eukprot:scaffold4018_cov143-Pinguiococcus_pyrenoidosus.AAC.1
MPIDGAGVVGLVGQMVRVPIREILLSQAPVQGRCVEAGHVHEVALARSRGELRGREVAKWAPGRWRCPASFVPESVWIFGLTKTPWAIFSWRSAGDR